MTESIARGLPLDEEPGLGSLTIGGYLQEVARKHAGREALVMHHEGERIAWSYDKLYERSLEVAKALIAAGVGKGTRVGVLMTNRPEHLASLFGIALAGGVTVSLSTFSTPSELEYMLQASAISILLFDRQVLKNDFGAVLTELEPAIRSARPGALSSTKFPFLHRLIALEPAAIVGSSKADGCAVERWSDFLAHGHVSEQHVLARAETVKPFDVGGLFFSSGTTSLPKGILHSHRAFAIQWWRWPRVLGVNEPVRSWTGNGFFWSANITMVVGTAFSTGGAVILQPTFEAEAALKLIDSERVTLMNGRPHQWARLQSAPNWSTSDLSTVRYVPRGELIRQHPTVQSQWERPNSFGTTETMTILSAYTKERPVERRPGAFGTPLPGNTIKIVDPQSNHLVPLGVRGEICIKGPTLMLGYVGKAPEDALDAEGYFHTGDGGHVDESGRLFWEGRLTHLIKTGGANVSPEEVDAAIVSFPGVKRTQTVGVPHETLSEMVVTCVVPVDGSTVNEDELITFLKSRLASFKIPRKVLLVDEADFALTANEKTKIDDMRKLAIARLGIAVATDVGSRE